MLTSETITDHACNFMQVLCVWENRTVGVATERLIHLVHEWCKKGYVIPEVWSSIKDMVDIDLSHLEHSCSINVAEQASEALTSESKYIYAHYV